MLPSLLNGPRFCFIIVCRDRYVGAEEQEIFLAIGVHHLRVVILTDNRKLRPHTGSRTINSYTNISSTCSTVRQTTINTSAAAKSLAAHRYVSHEPAHPSLSVDYAIEHSSRRGPYTHRARHRWDTETSQRLRYIRLQTTLKYRGSQIGHQPVPLLGIEGFVHGRHDAGSLVVWRQEDSGLHVSCCRWRCTHRCSPEPKTAW